MHSNFWNISFQEAYQPQQPSILNLIDTIAHIVNSSIGKSPPNLPNMPIFDAKMSPTMDDNKITPDLTSFKGDWNNMQPPVILIVVLK